MTDKMNKKGNAGDNLLLWYVAYIILGVIFFSMTYYWVYSYSGGAALMEDFYAKEIVRVLNDAAPGQEVYLDVSPATKIAFKNGLKEQNIFFFDNVKHSVGVSLTPKSGTVYPYFNDVIVRQDYKVELISGGTNTNRLHFFIVHTERLDE